MTQQPATAHPAFEWRRSQVVESLNLTVEEYRHRKTGAVHYHLAADFDENVFMVALRTVPMDNTGVAHILEHTVLCGSERYPVRDPFFTMIKRSLNTFMNAMTSSDWTAYPFASQNRKDFDNLLQVYLDAVFFSRLDPLDFAQEGHRLEFEVPDDANSALTYKGVVFNEMKGAMSSVPSTLWHTLSKYLYPETTYHYNSGGDPEAIPDLSYEQLLAFYRTHYHPSNAIFMTFGDIPAHQHQARFEELALNRFEALDAHIAVADEKRYCAPVRVEESYAWTEPGDAGDKTHIVMGWLLGKSTNLEDLFEAQLLASVLLDNSGSVLTRALETTELGSAPSPLCGMENSQLELVFVCGLEGSRPEHRDAVEALVLDVLRDVADNGVPQDQVDAVLHQLELQQREIGGDHYPYGLQLAMTALTAATHRGDPIALLDVEPALARLREATRDPDYIRQLARRLLLDNSHRVTLVMTPDRQLAERRETAERARLAAIKAGLSDAERKAIIERAQQLAAHQAKQDDFSILPKVGLDDIKPDIHVVSGERHTAPAMPITRYARGTNGLAYHQVLLRLPELTDQQLTRLPLLTRSLTEVGSGGRDYLATQGLQAQVTGGLSAYTSWRGAVDDTGQLDAYTIISGKALARNGAAQSELIQQTLEQPRFDEWPRLRELVAQYRARREQSVTGSGHQLAMTAAAAGLSPAAAWSHRWSGLAGLQELRVLDQALRSDDALECYGAELAATHQALLQGPAQQLLVAEAETLPALLEQFERQWANTTVGGNASPIAPRFQAGQVRQLWSTNTQVNFCAAAYPTVAPSHSDAAALTVLGGYLRNGYLHRAVREQGGAYGGGASHDASSGVFRFYSYRDPRLEETLADFDAALAWLVREPQDPEALEQAVLGVIGSLDKPGSPAGEAKQAFHDELFGRTPEQRRLMRQRILSVSLDDLRRVAQIYLTPERASVAVVTSQAQAERVAGTDDRWEICSL